MGSEDEKGEDGGSGEERARDPGGLDSCEREEGPRKDRKGGRRLSLGAPQVQLLRAVPASWRELLALGVVFVVVQLAREKNNNRGKRRVMRFFARIRLRLLLKVRC